MTEIEQTLRELLEGFTPDDREDPIEVDTPINSLGLESVVVMQFVAEVEDHFDINIDLDSLAQIHTLGDLGAVVVKAQGDA